MRCAERAAPRWRLEVCDMDLADSTVGQLLIPVEDLARAIAFYRDTLGLRFLFSAPPQMSFFQSGNVRLLVGVPEGDQPRRRGATVYFQVADIHAVFDTLAQRGVEFAATPHVVHRTATTELWLTEFRDPDGNHLALMSETPKRA
jgi:methylmalonyl-CoA/ethylmalonyl-CoA epimerase